MVCALAVMAPAQKKDKQDSNTRGLQGTVTDPDDKPVSGAVVQLKDMRTLQVRSFISQEDGSYHFSGLKMDNDYQVKADQPDHNRTSGWKTLSVFNSQKEPVMNLKLEKK
jgi:hypothetical protein